MATLALARLGLANPDLRMIITNFILRKDRSFSIPRCSQKLGFVATGAFFGVDYLRGTLASRETLGTQNLRIPKFNVKQNI